MEMSRKKAVTKVVVEGELRNRFVVKDWLRRRQGRGLRQVGFPICREAQVHRFPHLNLYLRDTWMLREGELKLLVKGKVIARIEIVQPGGFYLDHKEKLRTRRRNTFILLYHLPKRG